MTVELDVSDLTPFAPNLTEEKAEAMIADALALAARVAPCIEDADFAYEDAAKAIIRGAILRWIEASESGPTLVAGQFQVRPNDGTGELVKLAQLRARRALFWPSEVNDLQDLCKASADAVSMMSPGL